MPKTISRDFPLSELTLRRYERPSSAQLSERDAARKFCLSLGLLQPGDSRDVITDVLLVLLRARKKKVMLNAAQIRKQTIALRRKAKQPLKGIAHSNIRRQLKRLRDVYFVEKIKNNYRITEFQNITALLDEKIEQFYLPNILKRVKEYSQLLDEGE